MMQVQGDCRAGEKRFPARSRPSREKGRGEEVRRLGVWTMFSQGVVARRVPVVLCVLLMAGLWLSGCGKKGGTQKGSPHYLKAVRAYRRGDYGKAVTLFQKALAIEPSNAEIYLDIAAIYDDFLGNASGAVSYYEKYLQSGAAGDKAQWVRHCLKSARGRLALAEGQERPGGTEGETAADKDQLIGTLREQVQTATQALAEEREKATSLWEEVSSLQGKLSAADEENKKLQARVASYSSDGRGPVERKAGGRITDSGRSMSAERGRTLPVSWLLCAALGVLVVALIVRQRYASAREKALVAGIQAAASGVREDIRKDDILGKYYWVENDHSAGILSFTEKDGEIYACAIDGTTGLRSRGKGKLVSNVLTAELRSGREEGVVTKFIFANKARTVTAVWQGDEGTSVAAGTKAVGE